MQPMNGGMYGTFTRVLPTGKPNFSAMFPHSSRQTCRNFASLGKRQCVPA
jgi:hypothetical protein